MKACVLHGVHDLRYEDYPDPVIESPREMVVKVLRGGVCGSDIHYYEEGGIGETIRVTEPFVIGHEGIGVVLEVGACVTSVKPGDTVVIRPARPCLDCVYCNQGMFTYCENLRHLGSASLKPHVQGLFAEKVRIHEVQAYKVDKMDPLVGAFVEPLGVALHTIRQLGSLYGKKLLVMGAGPIGCLCVGVAKLMGADSVTVVDVRTPPLETARKMGADCVCNSRENPEQIAEWKQHRGSFDLMVEASGNAFAVMEGMHLVRPEGTIAQVGMFGNKLPTELGTFIYKGLHWIGVQRFYEEFPMAARALERGWIDPRPLFSGAFPAQECDAALKAAVSPDTCKVQIVFSE